MVYDCFMFFDELDLLEIRLNILDPVVDYFVITEATMTQMGNTKKMYFQEARSRFSRFEHKIIYNPIDDSHIKFKDQWHREVYQKNSCINGIKDAKEDDIIIFSDLDEIPNPEKVREIIENFDRDKTYHFAQELYYFFINYKKIEGTLLSAAGEFPNVCDKKWLGTRVVSYETAKRYGMDYLRHAEMIDEHAIRVDNGGWHFTYMGGTNLTVQERVKHKLGAFSHSEYNKWYYYNHIRIWLSIVRGRDLLGRNARFKRVKIDDKYPKWIRENYAKFPHLVLGGKVSDYL